MHCKAGNCVIAFGIPLSVKEYLDWRDNPRGRDLITSQNISWSQYRNEIVDLANKMIPVWRSRGVRVITSLDSGKFASLFCDPQTQVVILFSHWKGDNTIELFDGMINACVLAKKVPNSFNGIVDLCVCNSLLLAKLLKERGNVVVKSSSGEVVYGLWFFIYTAIFNLLDKQQTTYSEALLESLKLFLPRRKIA